MCATTGVTLHTPANPQGNSREPGLGLAQWPLCTSTPLAPTVHCPDPLGPKRRTVHFTVTSRDSRSGGKVCSKIFRWQQCNVGSSERRGHHGRICPTTRHCPSLRARVGPRLQRNCLLNGMPAGAPCSHWEPLWPRNGRCPGS